jgi:stage III sporulation protein SpoIIIAA
MKIITARIGNRNLLVQYSENPKITSFKKVTSEKKFISKQTNKISGYLFFTLDQNAQQSN